MDSVDSFLQFITAKTSLPVELPMDYPLDIWKRRQYEVIRLLNDQVNKLIPSLYQANNIFFFVTNTITKHASS